MLLIGVFTVPTVGINPLLLAAREVEIVGSMTYSATDGRADYQTAMEIVARQRRRRPLAGYPTVRPRPRTRRLRHRARQVVTLDQGPPHPQRLTTRPIQRPKTAARGLRI